MMLDTTTGRSRRRGVATACSVILAAAGVFAGSGVPPAAAAVTYPSPPYDFAHPGSPHTYNGVNLSPANGDNDRPLLIVVTMFTDQDRPNDTAASAIGARFFGPDSVTDYLRSSSFGKLTFTRAAETSGVENDGIVHADMKMTKAAWYMIAETTRGKMLLEAADDFVKFDSFNRNGDNRIDSNELTIMEVAEDETVPDCSGGTRGIDPVTLDGKDLASGRSYSRGVLYENKLTFAHEISHQALGHNDHDYRSGPLDISGATCRIGASEVWFDFNSWHKLHLGWTTPTVVAKDGYYSVGRWDTTGQSYLLYDPERGTNDYFLVENREPTAGSYDEDASDSGLMIWRVDDDNFLQLPPPYVLMRPDGTSPGSLYAGSDSDAWDPSDFGTPQRTMTQPWADGTAAKVAVRAIGDSGSTVRAFFDVRGPGVLVDPLSAVTEVTMLDQETLSVPVANTGEATDTFRFTLTGLPSGWTVTPATQSLAPCTGACTLARANIGLTVPAATPTGIYTLQVTGTSTTDGSVTSSAPIRVEVVKRATSLTYTGATDADYSDPAAVSAVLTDGATGQPLPGRSVHFELGDQATSPDPVTDSSGKAAGSITLDQAAQVTSVTADFDGDATYLGSDTSASFTITKETLSFVYTGSTLLALGTSPTLSATATEEADGSPGDLALATARFTLTPTLTATTYAYDASVAATGATSTPATGLPVDVWSVGVGVPSDNAYWTGASAAAAELVLFDPAARFTGDAAGRDTAQRAVRVVFDVRYDTRLRPRGTVAVQTPVGSFTGKDPRWVVQVGSRAIIDQAGTLAGRPASLRLRVDDNAEPARPDTFRVVTTGYDSGTVTVLSGNLQSHPAM